MDTRAARRWGRYKSVGPGILYAGAAIGVSHLVQSTRAGAGYGFALVWAVLAVHLFKYPFFEFGHRYPAATGENLLCGYRHVGRWALVGYIVVALLLSIPTAAVLTIVTAGMAAQLLPLTWSPMQWGLLLLGVCAVVLGTGGYPLLDRVMKILMIFLALCTLFAVAAATGHDRPAGESTPAPPLWNEVGIVFLIALMGWMPTPVDASAWASVWMEERVKQTGHRPTLREALFDFRLGYGASLLTAFMFLSLGALVMFGSGETFARSAGGFAAQFVEMYSRALGGWARPIVVTVAFAAMLSTLLTVLDGYPRVLSAGCRLVWPVADRHHRTVYWIVMVLMMGGTLFIFGFLTSRMRPLIDGTTVLAFLSAPLFAYLNHRVIVSDRLPREARPPRWLIALSWAGLAFLICFSIVFLVVRFGGSA